MSIGGRAEGERGVAAALPIRNANTHLVHSAIVPLRHAYIHLQIVHIVMLSHIQKCPHSAECCLSVLSAQCNAIAHIVYYTHN